MKNVAEQPNCATPLTYRVFSIKRRASNKRRVNTVKFEINAPDVYSRYWRLSEVPRLFKTEHLCNWFSSINSYNNLKRVQEPLQYISAIFYSLQVKEVGAMYSTLFWNLLSTKSAHLILNLSNIDEIGDIHSACLSYVFWYILL